MHTNVETVALAGRQAVCFVGHAVGDHTALLVVPAHPELLRRLVVIEDELASYAPWRTRRHPRKVATAPLPIAPAQSIPAAVSLTRAHNNPNGSATARSETRTRHRSRRLGCDR